jgi:hypothetical protein
MGLKYQCDIPGFEDCWFELSERWTRGQVKAFFADRGEDFLNLIRSKIVAIHFTTDSGAIDHPDQLTVDATDDVDMVLWKWFSTALNTGVDELYSMGEAHARRWSGEYAKLMAARLDNPKLN